MQVKHTDHTDLLTIYDLSTTKHWKKQSKNKKKKKKSEKKFEANCRCRYNLADTSFGSQSCRAEI